MQLSVGLRDELSRWLDTLGKDPTPFAEGCVREEVVLRAHFAVAEHFVAIGEGIAGVGPRDVTLFRSTVYRQHTGFGGRKKYNTLYERAAALFFGIIKNHPFIDANKRTAVLVLIYQIAKGQRVLDLPEDDLELLALRTASNTLADYGGEYRKYRGWEDQDVCFLTSYIRRHSRALDGHLPVITFRELRGCLKRFHVTFENPNGNYIDVMQEKDVETRVLGIFPKTTKRKVFVAQVGYPGENFEVGVKSLKTILRETGLTADKGYDSKVVFRGFEPLHTLTQKYRNLLERLAHK